MLPLDGPDEATKYHVYRGGVEGWGDENEDGLDDKAAEGVLVVVTPYSSSVSDCLDCRRKYH